MRGYELVATEKVFTSDKIPYVPERAGALSLQIRPPKYGLSFEISAQYTGPQLIQEFPQDGLPDTFVPTEAFYTPSDANTIA